MKYVIGSLGCIAVLAIAACSQSIENSAPATDSVQFSDMKDAFKRAKKAKKDADKVKDAVETAGEVKDTIKGKRAGKKSSGGLDDLQKQVEASISEYNRCSDFLIVRGQKIITLTGATGSLKSLQPDLPKSDNLNANKIIQVPKDICKFVKGVRAVQSPKDKELPMMRGPGRQEVKSDDEKKDVKIRFDFDKSSEFARLYYMEWRPESAVLEFADLLDEDSRRSVFGRDALPLSKSGKSYVLEHDDSGPIKISGYGPRMIALVQSDEVLDINSDSAEDWLKSVRAAQLSHDTKVAVAWTELFTPK